MEIQFTERRKDVSKSADISENLRLQKADISKSCLHL
jgi:hypothetical protein